MDTLATLLGKAADSLGIQAVRLWPHLVRITWIDALVSSVVWSCVAAIAILVFRNRYRAWQAVRLTDQRVDTQENYAIGAIISGIIAAILLAISLVCIGSSVPAIFEPEGAALFTLLKR